MEATIVVFTVDAAKVARIASEVRKEQIDRTTAEKFLDIYAQDLEDALTKTACEFVVGKFRKG